MRNSYERTWMLAPQSPITAKIPLSDMSPAAGRVAGSHLPLPARHPNPLHTGPALVGGLRRDALVAQGIVSALVTKVRRVTPGRLVRTPRTRSGRLPADEATVLLQLVQRLNRRGNRSQLGGVA